MLCCRVGFATVTQLIMPLPGLQGPIAGQAMRRSVQGMLEELEYNLWEHILCRLVDYGHTFSPEVCILWVSVVNLGCLCILKHMQNVCNNHHHASVQLSTVCLHGCCTCSPRTCPKV